MKLYTSKIIFIFIILFLFNFSLYSFDSADEVELTKVTLALKWYHQFQFAGYYAAVEKGFYRDEGLDVKLTIPESGILPVESVLKGKAEYGVSASDLVVSRTNGDPVVVIAVIFQHSPIILLSRKDSSIKYLTDLLGKTVMTGSDDFIEIQAMIKKEGIKIENINFIDHTWTVDSIVNGDVDASVDYITNEPYLLRKNNVEPHIIMPVDYGIDFYGDSLFTTEDEIKYHPDRVRAFRRASIKGWNYAFDNMEEIVEIILNMPGVKENGKTREHLLYEAEQMYNLIQPKLVEIGHMNASRWQHIAEIYAENNVIPEDYSIEGFIFDPESESEVLKKYLYLILIILSVVLIITAIVIFSNYK